MSLVRFALRHATIQSLKRATLAVDRVFDSRIEPINLTAPKERMPFIVVVTDDDTSTVQGRDIIAAERDLDIVIEIAVATQVMVDAGTANAVVPDTDGGYEVVLDLLERQIIRALTGTVGTWPTLWRDLAPRIQTVVSRRSADQQQGVRYAARQLVVTVTPLADPPFGEVPITGSVWARLVSAMGATPEIAALAPVIAAEMAAGSVLDWQQAQVELGLNNDELRGIGLAPAFEPTPSNPNDTEVPPPVDAVTYSTITITETSISEQVPDA